MAVCMAQRGFLTLGACGETAASMCMGCGQPSCAMHLSAQSGFTKCVSCTAADPTVEETGDEYDGVWSNRYRDNYYSETGYTGTHSSSYYDSTDAQSFEGDPKAQDWTEGEEGGGEGSGFGES